MVPTSVTSLLAHRLGQGSAGKTRPSSQDKYLNFIELAMEEVDMAQWLESGRMGRPGGRSDLEENPKGQHWLDMFKCIQQFSDVWQAFAGQRLHEA